MATTDSPDYSPGGRNYVIPKKSDTSRLYRNVELTSRDFQNDLYPAIRRSFRLSDSENRVNVTRVQLVRNQQALDRYTVRKEAMKDGKTEKELGESLAFLGCKSEQLCHKICSEGIHVGNVQYTMLGQAKMGVCVQKHADILWMRRLDTHHTNHMIVFKILKGRIKTVTGNCSTLEPTPNFDCHVPAHVNSPNLNDLKSLYNASQIYLYEYGDLGVKDRPGQICPFAIVHYELKEPSAILPMKMSTLISPALPQSVSIWDGKLYNKDNIICAASLMSFGMMFKPTPIGLKINLQCTISFQKFQDKYLKNITEISLRKEIHNGQTYLSYFLLQAKDNPKFDKLRRWLEETKTLAVWYCGNRVDGILLPATSQTTALGFPVVPNPDKCLHCIFASPYSLSTRLAMARDRLNKTQLSNNQTPAISSSVAFSTNQSAIPKPVTTTTNYDDGYLPTCPPKFLLRNQSIQAAFRSQMASIQAVFPPTIPTVPAARNPIRPFKPPPPANLPPSKLDPRTRRTSATSTSVPVDNSKVTNTPPDRPTVENSAPVSETSKDSAQHIHRQEKLDDSDLCLTPYSPTQFSPLDSAEALDTENDLNSSNRVHLPKLRLMSVGQNNVDAKRDETMASLQINVLGTLNDVAEAAGTEQASFLQVNQVKKPTLPEQAQKPVQRKSTSVRSSIDYEFLDRVGRWELNNEPEESIPFLDSSAKNGLNNSANQHHSTCGQGVTYGSIHSIDAMKSYLNASINRTAKFMAKVKGKVGSVSKGKEDLPNETQTDGQPASNKLTICDQLDRDTNDEGSMMAEQRLNSTSGTTLSCFSVRPGLLTSESNDIKNGDSSTDNSLLKRKSIDSVDESINSGKRLKPSQAVRVIPLENSTTPVKDPRLVAKIIGNQPKAVQESREVEERITNMSSNSVDKTVHNAIKEFHAVETSVLKNNCDGLENSIQPVSWTRVQANESSSLTDDMGFETYTHEMQSRWKQVNSFKLSSFTTIFNQENEKVKVQPEKLEELKDKVMTFTEELMNRVAKTAPCNGLVNGEQNGAVETTDNENEGQKVADEISKDLDCTQEIMSDEMDKFYVELAKIIPLEKDYIRSLMETNAKKKPLQCGVLSKLKCMAQVLNESLSDKYMKCMLKCELKKFLMLVENLFTSIFIISESENGRNNHVVNSSFKFEDTSQQLLGQRYSDFKCALHKLMTSYGLNLNADRNAEDVTPNVSILERLNEPNLHVDSIINEKHEEMTKILDDILDGKNSKNSRTFSAISSNVSANGKQLVLQYRPKFTDSVIAGSENGFSSGGRQIEIKISNAPSSSTPSASRHVTNLADFIASQTSIDSQEIETRQKQNGSRDVQPNEIQNGRNEIVARQNHVDFNATGEGNVDGLNGDVTPRATSTSFHSNMNDEASQSKITTTKSSLVLRRKVNQACNLSRKFRRHVLKEGDKPKDVSRCYAQFKKHLINYQLMKEKQKSTLNSSLTNRSISRYLRTGRVGKKIKKQQQLQNALFHLGNAFSEMYSSTPKQMTKMLATHGSNLGTLLKGLAEDVDKLVKPLSSVKKKKRRLVKKKRCQDSQVESLSTVPYEDGYFDESAQLIMPNYLNPDGASSGLYFVYGSDSDVCNPVKSYLQSLGHRPYGSNNRETVLAVERGEPLYVFIHNTILSKPHCIPDLVTLKHMPNSYFYSFENESDLQSEKCTMLFPAGGVFIPDLKVVSEIEPEKLRSILSSLMSRPDWIMLIHHHIVQHLEKSCDEESETYSENASELMNIINTSQLRGLGIMDSHDCDDKSNLCAVDCLRNVQLDELHARRHIVYVSDMTCLDSLYTELQLSGISITSLGDLKSRYLETTSTFFG